MSEKKLLPNKARTGPKQDILKHWLVPQKHLNTHQYNKALSLNGSLFRDPGPYRDTIIYIYIGSLLGPYLFFRVPIFSAYFTKKWVPISKLGGPYKF